MKNKVRNIFFAFGIIAIIVMILTFKVSFVEIWADIRKTGLHFALILGLWLVLYIMNALTWRVIIKGSGDCNISFWKLIKITISGFALNYVTPAGLMGGEPYKILELSPYIGHERATSSVLLFAMTHIFAHFWYWLTSVLLFIVLIITNLVSLNYEMSIVLPSILVFSILGIYLFIRGYKNGMVVRIINVICKLPFCKKLRTSLLENHLAELKNIDSQIAQLQNQNQKSFWGSLLLEYVGRVMQSFEIYILLMIVGIQGSPLLLFTYSFIILAFTSLFANILFFLPLQIGGREGGFAMSTMQLNLIGESGSPIPMNEIMTIAMFISIICRVRELFWTTVGLILMKISTKVKIKDI
ncbi:MAG: flippase-like domain-containing protein [Bacteroidaceae bacterium]|nr:flippase-like domain-containing protein [Bacteroidaceae bacterium]